MFNLDRRAYCFADTETRATITKMTRLFPLDTARKPKLKQTFLELHSNSRLSSAFKFAKNTYTSRKSKEGGVEVKSTKRIQNSTTLTTTWGLNTNVKKQ